MYKIIISWSRGRLRGYAPRVFFIWYLENLYKVYTILQLLFICLFVCLIFIQGGVWQARSRGESGVDPGTTSPRDPAKHEASEATPSSTQLKQWRKSSIIHFSAKSRNLDTQIHLSRHLEFPNSVVPMKGSHSDSFSYMFNLTFLSNKSVPCHINQKVVTSIQIRDLTSRRLNWMTRLRK